MKAQVKNADTLEIQIHEIEKEFPDDPALQQVHIARKLISQEAEQCGLNYFDFLKTQVQKFRNPQH